MILTHTIINPDVEDEVHQRTGNTKLSVENPQQICEYCARVCYDSLAKFGSNEKFLDNILNAKHLDIAEHVYLAAKLPVLLPKEQYYGYYVMKQKYPYLDMSFKDNSLIIAATGRVWNEIDNDDFTYFDDWLDEIDELKTYLNFIMPSFVKKNRRNQTMQHKILQTFNTISRQCIFPIGQKTQFGSTVSLLSYAPPVDGLFHATFKFTDVSRAMTHQHVRHRRFVHSQQSDRYCEPKDSRHYVHNPKYTDDKVYIDSFFELTLQAYDTLRKLGHKKEDARGVLPTNISSNIVTSGDLAAWNHYLSERTATGAQDEIRTNALIVQNIMETITK